MATGSIRDLSGLGEIQALLGRGAEFEGVLAFEGRVRIDGRFKGKVFSDGVLVLGDGAEVEAEIEVGTLIVRGGTLRGNVIASQLVEIHAEGAVHGDVRAPTIDIDKGCIFEGSVHMTGSPAAPTPLARPRPKIAPELLAERRTVRISFEATLERDDVTVTDPSRVALADGAKREMELAHLSMPELAVEQAGLTLRLRDGELRVDADVVLERAGSREEADALRQLVIAEARDGAWQRPRFELPGELAGCAVVLGEPVEAPR